VTGTPAPAAPDLAAAAALLADPAAGRAALARDPAAYGWLLFLALNQPLDRPGTRVWETAFRQTSTIYLPDGARPAPWGEAGDPSGLPPPPAGGCVPAGVRHDLDTAIQVDGLTLADVWGQDVRYQLLMNRPAFDYLLTRGFYNVNGQELAAAQGRPADFPADAFELKTSWLWLGTDPQRCAQVRGKYWVANAYFQQLDRDGQPAGWEVGYAALAGMHIINKALPQWVWITFENLANDQFTSATLELPIDAGVQAANRAFQGWLAGQGSVFANYRLDGVQTAFTEPASPPGAPTLLANSTIESAFQTQSSCITCHSLASIKPDGEYFNIVDTQGGNVAYYVGDPPDVAAQGFTGLDFVWSLKRASRQRVP
jgi:hypothetical protein